jgi:transcriptional regulator with XRE-family HTH domain
LPGADVQDAIDTKIGGQVRLWRCLKGMRTEDLAREIGLTPAHLALIEDGRGRLGASRLFAAARTMGVSVSTLIDGASRNWL